MTNMTIDFIRIPVDKNGNLIYDYEEASQIYKKYQESFPDHKIIMLPSNITIWEDLDITVLKSIYQYLGEIIIKKEQNNND